MITMRQFAQDETIIKESEAGETAFVIEKGKVEVSKEMNGKVVHIAYLEKGATFGEMSMVDDMPRSATVRALEETMVREIHRDDLYSSMKENPDIVIKLLKSLFERLREANVQITRQGQDPETAPPEARPAGITSKPSAFVIEGLTPKAIGAMSSNPTGIRTFPFKIGRKSQDPMVTNHLALQDQAPLQISRHHVSIIKEGGRIGVVDRGSQLGASVDGVRIGGSGRPGPVFFEGSEGILVLGGDESPYRYRISVAPQGA